MISSPLAPVGPLLAAAVLLLAALATARGGRLGPWLAAAGAAILAGALAARGLRAGHWPLTGEYEFALAFALGTVLATLALAPPRADRPPKFRKTSEVYVNRDRRSYLQEGGPAVAALLFAAGLLAYARLLMPASKQAIRPLLPALNSPWLPLHVATAALAYGALALAGLAGLVWLLREEERAGTGQTLERAIAAGYPLLTLSLLLGMVWAQVAWGRYWGWDLKEVWTLITWLVYTLYWHLRNRRGWQGRRLAGLALLGLGAVLFTFLGAGGLARQVGLESLHLF